MSCDVNLFITDLVLGLILDGFEHLLNLPNLSSYQQHIMNRPVIIS